MSQFITKQDYLLFKKCPRLLAYSVSGLQTYINDSSEYKQFLANQGKDVGILARTFLSEHDSHLVSSKSFSSAITQTEEFLKTADVIFEGLFKLGDLVTRPDALKPKSKMLIEVKASTSVSEEHIYDISFQAYVLSGLGIDIETYWICFLNKNYVFKNDIVLAELFLLEDVSDLVHLKLNEIETDLHAIRKIKESNQMPARCIGNHCNAGFVCPYKNDCWEQNIDDTIFNLRRDVSGKKFDLHKAGVRSIKDIPDYVQLTKYQSLQKEAEIQNCSVIDHTAIANALAKIVYPICFLDFETFSLAIPNIDMSFPYQQIPSQASIHFLKGPDHKPKHFSFLHDKDSDPRSALTKFLLETLGNSGTIVVYHASFEIGRLYELIKVSPTKETELIALIDRVWDLETIFEKGMLVHSGFLGSTSIKKVLPVLCPELSYDGLEINNGMLASIQYLKMISPRTNHEDKLKIKKDLEDYCEKDTFAMYAILKKLWRIL